jgi:hypothetical protein
VLYQIKTAQQEEELSFKQLHQHQDQFEQSHCGYIAFSTIYCFTTINPLADALSKVPRIVGMGLLTRKN